MKTGRVHWKRCFVSCSLAFQHYREIVFHRNPKSIAGRKSGFKGSINVVFEQSRLFHKPAQIYGFDFICDSKKLKVRLFPDALDDCSAAIKLDSANIRAYERKG